MTLPIFGLLLAVWGLVIFFALCLCRVAAYEPQQWFAEDSTTLKR